MGCVLVDFRSVVLVVCAGDCVDVILLMLWALGGQKWGSKNREKWSSGMGVLQN